MRGTNYLVMILSVVMICGCFSSTKKEPLTSKKFANDKRLTAAEKAHLRYIEGRQVCAQNNYAGAIPYFKQAVEFEEKTEYYNDLGRCYQMIGRYGDALRAYARAEVLDDGKDREYSATLQANIGDVFQQRDDLPEALKYYYEAVSLAPDYARAHYEIGSLLLKNGKFAEAEQRLTTALKIDPSFNKALLARMISYRLTNQYEKAYQDLQDLDNRGFAVQEDLQDDIIRGMQS